MEKKYPNQIVVLGIHSAKFDNEKDSASIKKAMLRYERHDPVLNDANRKVWKAYAVDAWPTLFIIDPEGNAVGRINEEKIFNIFDKEITELVRIHRSKGTLNEKPLRFGPASDQDGESALFFPGKVLADEASRRLFIADSTHHRIVITDLDGKKIAVAGNGLPGSENGPFDEAGFNDPQGMALRGDILYVADRKNHLIRALDLKARTVKTVAGTGEQGVDFRRGGPALQTGLNSPWDLLVRGNTLFIAMAGHHQIWTLDLATQRAAPFAGTAFENLQDGPRFKSCFAQPSGLATDGVNLYVADSEVSSIRSLPLSGLGEVSTIVGQGLFDFGDVDGFGKKVRLQHALGIVHHQGKLYVADTYNSKIKVIDPKQRTSYTFLGQPGGWLTEPLFNEPGGISYADGKLYVADTNAHRIRVVDLKTRNVSTLTLKGVEAPKR